MNSNGNGSRNDSLTRNDVSQILAAIENHNRIGAELLGAVKRISSLPPAPAQREAAAAILEPSRQDKILSLLADATREQRGLPTSEIAAKLGINRQQVQTALIPLEKSGRVVTMRGPYEQTPEGPRRSHADMVFDRAALLDGWRLDGIKN